MATSVNADIAVRIALSETAALDQGTRQMLHELLWPGTLHNGSYLTGTTDEKQNLCWSDSRSLAATSETLDLYGGLSTDISGTTINFVEVRGICIINTATVAGSILTVGNGTNPAFAGLFQAATQRIIVPAGGIFLWTAPYDAGGLTVTNTTAQDFKIDSGAATITYKIAVWGVDA